MLYLKPSQAFIYAVINRKYQMNFKDLKIGYVPYLPDLSQPADRRRFPFFAKAKNIDFEIADQNKAYDVILLTAFADLSQWLVYKRKHPRTKFIFEMVDSLIFSQSLFDTLFKGIGKYILGKESALHFSYRNILIEWIKSADLVICSSTAMKEILMQWNANVIVSLDYMQNEVKTFKKDYDINGKMKLVWEGQGVVLQHVLHFKELFKRINGFCEFHVITDEQYPRFGGLLKKDITNITRQLPIETFFHKWKIYKNFEQLIDFDCGIIPLDNTNSMAWHKPANKLISFSFAGMPTVVSNTPAYVEFMDRADTGLYCSDIDQWVSKLKEIYEMSAGQRKEIALKNFYYVNENYSNDALHRSWYEIFGRLE